MEVGTKPMMYVGRSFLALLLGPQQNKQNNIRVTPVPAMSRFPEKAQGDAHPG